MYKRLTVVLCCLLILILACTTMKEDTGEVQPLIEEELEEIVCSEGDVQNYVCPDGTEVEWCVCDVDENDWSCIISPEVSCPEELPEEINWSTVEHTLYVGESVLVAGKEVKFEKFFDRELVSVSVDGVEGRLIPTKNLEIIKNYGVYLTYVQYKGSTHSENHIKLVAFPYPFGESEYLLEKLKILDYDGYELKLIESDSDDFIRVYVDKKGTSFSETLKIYEGRSESYANLTVKNIDGFWQYKQYALVELTKISP